MEKKGRFSKVLIYQSIGFLVIILLSWLDEWLKLPSLIFRDHPYISNFHESAIEMLMVLVVWLIVSGATTRALAHMRHLARFMRVCSWCRKINCKDEWMPIEDFMSQGFDTPTTHGICPHCLERELEAIKRAKAAKGLKAKEQMG